MILMRRTRGEAGRRAGRGEEYDPMTGKLVSIGGAAATKEMSKKTNKKKATALKPVASRLHGGGDSTSTS